MVDRIHDLMHTSWDPLLKLLESTGLGFSELSTILFALSVCTLMPPWVIIFRKAGYSLWRGFLMLIPIVNVFVFFAFAFGDWPIARELRELRYRWLERIPPIKSERASAH